VTGTKDILIRYGEIGIKGKNRSDFEKTLQRNVKRALSGTVHGQVERPRGRIIVRDVKEPAEAQQTVSMLPGIISTSLAMRAGHGMDSILHAAAEIVREAAAVKTGGDPLLFKVETTRSNKAFPLTSMELSSELGGLLIERFPGLKARMKNPELLLNVEVRFDEVLVSGKHMKGPGGLPVDSMGKVVVLLSGGIDSPVAAYMAMKRGARAVFINFHSYPLIPDQSLEKIKNIVRALNAFQGWSSLYTVPFVEIQTAIRDRCPEALRTVLYRRMMTRLACKAADDSGALALVTGESLGQVASQTLENIRCIGDASSLPILRPLIGFDKTEAVDAAKRIGTYEISILPYPDSCTVFMPRHPKIRASLKELEDAECAIDAHGMVDEAFSKTERMRL